MNMHPRERKGLRACNLAVIIELIIVLSKLLLPKSDNNYYNKNYEINMNTNFLGDNKTNLKIRCCPKFI